MSLRKVVDWGTSAHGVACIRKINPVNDEPIRAGIGGIPVFFALIRGAHGKWIGAGL